MAASPESYATNEEAVEETGGVATAAEDLLHGANIARCGRCSAKLPNLRTQVFVMRWHRKEHAPSNAT